MLPSPLPAIKRTPVSESKNVMRTPDDESIVCLSRGFSSARRSHSAYSRVEVLENPVVKTWPRPSIHSQREPLIPSCVLASRTQALVRGSQTFIFLSLPIVTNCEPSSFHDMSLMLLVWPSRRIFSSAFSMSHRRVVRSVDTDASTLAAVGWNLTCPTLRPWPERVSSGVSMFSVGPASGTLQTLTRQSSDADATMKSLKGLKAVSSTCEVCPVYSGAFVPILP
eukprot:Amastigsp_a676658_24.p3 type:complete len:224 gc:universal Amastigsp_a676658_24:904-233(-)